MAEGLLGSLLVSAVAAWPVRGVLLLLCACCTVRSGVVLVDGCFAGLTAADAAA